MKPLSEWIPGTEGLFDGYLRVYHGTLEKNLPGIILEGLKPPPGVSPAGWYMVTTDRAWAAFHSQGETAVILEYRIPLEEVRTYLWPGSLREDGHSQYGIRRPLPGEFIVERQA